MRTNQGDYPVFKLVTGPHAGSDLEEVSIDGQDIKGQRIRSMKIEANANDIVRVTIEHVAVVADMRVKGEVRRVVRLLFQEEQLLPSEEEGGEPKVHVVSKSIDEEGATVSEALRKLADRLDTQVERTH